MSFCLTLATLDVGADTVMRLLDIRAADGSRKFASLPERAPWRALRAHIAALPGAEERLFVSDDVVEAWLDFTYHGYDFSIHNPFGEYWFFVSEPDAPETILTEVAEHCERLLGAPLR